MTPLFALLLAVAPLPPEEARFQPQAKSDDPRMQRPWVFSGEVGWNGLAGVGLVVARHLAPHFTIDAGLGISAEAAKVGLRARYGFGTSAWQPFVAAGFLYGTGSDALQTEGTGAHVFTYRVGPSPYLQLVGGLEYQADGHYNFTVAGGYAHLLRENLTIAGSPTDEDRDALRIATGSGPVISLSWGYAF